MADKELIQILRQGVEKWNAWRQEHPEVTAPDLSQEDLVRAGLSGAKLSGAKLSGANLSNGDLSGADLSGADLSGALLYGTNLSNAQLYGANLSNAYLYEAVLRGAYLYEAGLTAASLNYSFFTKANLTKANFTGADLSDAKFYDANLSGANLSGAKLHGTNLSGADLSGANLHGAIMYITIVSGVQFGGSFASGTVFSDIDLRDAKGLDAIRHVGPSEISISTIYKSEGEIPKAFLLGCGVPESFIVQIPALVGAMQPIQFHSCFISYSTKDEEFARRLHARMRQEGLRVWFAPEDMKGGDYFSDQIDRAIQVHDRLLLVISENSMASNWVIREIKRARKVEERENRKKLFPISLTGYEVLRGWECLDHDSGLDLAEEVQKFHIPDFSNWKNQDDFEREFSRLYESLKAES